MANPLPFLLVAAMLLAPSVVAEEAAEPTSPQDTMIPLDHGDDHEDSPGFGILLLLLGVMGLAWYQRRH